jgi:isoleucyl-tRNA synthetase
MYLIADGLTRVIAPILPFTADEMWRHLPSANREASVHLAEFPTRRSVEALADSALVSRWQRLIGIRDDVNRALESARQGKTIGNSLGARVSLRAGGPTAALLEQYRHDLPMLFIVSQVDLQLTGTAEDLLGIDVARAEGYKCARCWRIVEEVSAAADTEGLCSRCVSALAGPQAA